MNKYKKGNSIIFATEKSYNAIYKNQGYVPCDVSETQSLIDNTELETVKVELDATKETLANTTTELETVKKSAESMQNKIEELTAENEKLKADLEKKTSKAKKEENKENE